VSYVKIFVLIISSFSGYQKDCSPEICAGVDFWLAGATSVATIDDGIGDFRATLRLFAGSASSPLFSIDTFAGLTTSNFCSLRVTYFRRSPTLQLVIYKVGEVKKNFVFFEG
jgi:hypothetical protein